FGGGTPSTAGQHLLEVLQSFGPLGTAEEKQRLVDAYPDGIDDERDQAGRDYERQAIRTAQETFLASWLVDGIDDYEHKVFAIEAETILPSAALRHALEDGAFRS